MSVLRMDIRIVRYQSEESGEICHGSIDRTSAPTNGSRCRSEFVENCDVGHIGGTTCHARTIGNGTYVTVDQWLIPVVWCDTVGHISCK